MQIEDTLFFSSPNSQLTLTTLSAILLKLAEEWYGERKQEHLYLGVEFGNQGIPMTAFSVQCLGGISTGQTVWIRLGEQARDNKDTALFQLTQETVHLLSAPAMSVSVLEEGLTQIFSENACIKFGWKFLGCTGDYLPAKQRVKKLLDLDPDNDAIKKLRAVENSISSITPQILMDTITGMDQQLANELAMPFHGHGLT